MDHSGFVTLVNPGARHNERPDSTPRGPLSSRSFFSGRVSFHNNPKAVFRNRLAIVCRNGLLQVSQRIRQPAWATAEFRPRALECAVQAQQRDWAAVAGFQRGPLAAEHVRAGASRAANCTTKASPGPTLMFVSGQVHFLAFSCPGRDNFLAGDAPANFTEELHRDIVALHFRGGGVHVLIYRPAALRVAAATGTGASLQIVQEHSAPAGW